MPPRPPPPPPGLGGHGQLPHKAAGASESLRRGPSLGDLPHNGGETFRVSGLGFRVWGLGFGVWGLGFGDLGFDVWHPELGMPWAPGRKRRSFRAPPARGALGHSGCRL